ACGEEAVTIVRELHGGSLRRGVGSLTLRVKRHLPLILHATRGDGAIPEKICSLHHVPMTVELLPILWGLIEPWGDEMTYFDAQEKRFPNAREMIFGGCEEGTETTAE